jgi:hypothetical protein
MWLLGSGAGRLTKHQNVIGSTWRQQHTEISLWGQKLSKVMVMLLNSFNI